MFGFRTVPCALCDQPIPRKDALRLQQRKDTVICEACYSAWDRDGRK